MQNNATAQWERPRLQPRSFHALQCAVLIGLLNADCEITVSMSISARSGLPLFQARRLFWKNAANEITDEVDIDEFVAWRVKEIYALESTQMIESKAKRRREIHKEAEYMHLLEDFLLEKGITCIPIRPRQHVLLATLAWIITDDFRFGQPDIARRGSAIHDVLTHLSGDQTVFTIPRMTFALQNVLFPAHN